MKLNPVCIAIKALSLIVSLQFSCDYPIKAGSSTRSTQGDIQSREYLSDNELLQQVEAFASSDPSASKKAWNALESYGRHNVTSSLSRLYASSSPEDYHRILIAFTFCMLHHEYATNRRIVLSGLSKSPPFKNFYGDWAVSLVQRLMLGGDKALLADLFRAAEWSDGAMSEELSGAYSQALATDPRAFLLELKRQPKKNRRNIYVLLKDHSLSLRDREKVTAFLASVRSTSALHQVAEETLKALQK